MILSILGAVFFGIVIYIIILSKTSGIAELAKQEQPKKPPLKTKAKPTEQPQPSDVTWPGKGEFLFDVVGESNYQAAIKELAGDHGDREPKATFIASLIPDDDNPHDDKAIRVEINRKHVGYMSREDARSFRRRLGTKKLTNQTTTCHAKITGGWVGKDGKRVPYGIRLDIKPFW